MILVTTQYLQIITDNIHRHDSTHRVHNIVCGIVSRRHKFVQWKCIRYAEDCEVETTWADGKGSSPDFVRIQCHCDLLLHKRVDGDPGSFWSNESTKVVVESCRQAAFKRNIKYIKLLHGEYSKWVTGNRVRYTPAATESPTFGKLRTLIVFLHASTHWVPVELIAMAS